MYGYSPQYAYNLQGWQYDQLLAIIQECEGVCERTISIIQRKIDNKIAPLQIKGRF